jgi:toxin-antitoxin system PIN domain toxin
LRALLDVNVLIALLDDAHVHHRRARDWLGEHIGGGWASCAITQLGCLRIMSNAKYPSPRPAAAVAQRLAAAARTPHHEFWAARVDPLGSTDIDWSLLLSPRHTTDVYLLALAVAHGGRLVTFDAHVPWRAVRGAEPGHYVSLE